MPRPLAPPSARAPFALGVVILGAGASSRMGRPKLLLPWSGTSILGHLIGQWRALAAEQIAVVGAAGDRALAAELDRLGFPRADRICNPAPGRGMFSSIRCAANWAGWTAGLTGWIITLGDQPHLRPATLRALVEFGREHPDTICQPAWAGRPRHPVLLPRHAFLELRRSGAATLREFLEHPVGPRADLPVDDPGLSLDLDGPADYEKAVHLFLRQI